ncbi:MAG: hypothetical protein AAB787_00470 [Patescibacteria group bacterium]
MKDFKRFFRYKWNNLSLALGFVLIFGGWLWAYLKLRVIEVPVVILYNEVEGVTRAGEVGEFLKVLVFGLLVLVINFFISAELEERSRFWARLSSIFTIFLAVLIFIYFAAIISVN